MSKKYLKGLFILLLLIGFTLPALAQYVVDLSGNVPLYGQEDCCWCGAASGQMIMDGYPDPADRLYHEQEDIWDAIQVNNSMSVIDIDAGWCTDPEGLRQTLIDMNPPPWLGTWNVFTNPIRNEALFDILYWMNWNDYPVATLIDEGGHWVVIVGYETDIEPVGGSNPVLQEITKYDPDPHNVGSVITMDAAVWYATDWVGPVQYAGTWHDQYVAVIEPPVIKGTVEVKMVERIGKEIIPPEEAIKYAKKWIDELELYKKPPYAILQRSGVNNLQPILVREEIKPGLEKEKEVPYYYIVPFGFEYEIGARGIGLARVCMIVNAYTGRFEEIGAFGKPVRYLPEEEVIDIIARSLGLKREEMKEFKPTLMFQPSDITHIRLYPFWRIMVKDRILYVDQLGKIYRTIKPSVPGD
jgi:hypothetical protein